MALNVIAMVSPFTTGVLYALAAAVTFGISTPLLSRAQHGVGPWTVAALLYSGALAVAALSRRDRTREAALDGPALRRLAVAGSLGAMLAPAAFAWGVARTGALSASLALTCESVFTIAVAAAIFREHIAARVVSAAALIAAGAAILLARGASDPGVGALGLTAVVVATLLWAVDNAITGTVSRADPSTVVAAKSAFGVAGSVVVAVTFREPWPSLGAAAALVAIGAVGYGGSLRWYLLAQRTFGVARTASVFGTAPFIGALAAVAAGERTAGVAVVAAAVLMAAGMGLHSSEHHAHEHAHAALEHEHAHRHDDGHHAHHHAEQPAGTHSHPHAHPPLVHDHPHAPDLHHGHRHAD